MMTKYKMILASGSPRRKDLLLKLIDDFDIIVSDCDETTTETKPQKVVTELAIKKALAVAKQVQENCVITGADTVVVCDDIILGKPSSIDAAREMISLLQGRAHQVMTGVALIEHTQNTQQIHSFCVETQVYVAAMTKDEIEEYIATTEPYDKAGGYGIQGLFSRFVEKIDGDYENVVGLPIQRLYQELKDAKLLL